MVKAFVKAMQICESISGTGSDDIKKEALSNLDLGGQRLMVEMFSIFRVFGIKQYDLPSTFAATDADYQPFFSLLDQLHARELTGNAARAEVTNVFSLYTAETVKYLARVLDKDAKAGFSESTVNKVFPKLVPVFKAMKGEKVDVKKKKNKDGTTTITPFDFKKNTGFPARIEIKHDGLRSIVFSSPNPGDPVLYYSYEGRLQEQWQGLFDDEVNALAIQAGEPIVLDAEVEGNNFLETIRAKKEGNDLGKENLRLKAFDLLTQVEWKNEKTVREQNVRSNFLDQMLVLVKPAKIIQTEFTICEDENQLKAFHAKAVADGYEGTMIKTVNGLYEWKRSSNWWKWKPVMTVDLTIVDFYEGKKGTKNEGTLGGLTLEGEDENGNKIKTNCGGLKVRGGLLDEWLKSIGIDLKNTKDITKPVRDELWNNKEKYRGMVAEIEGQELTLGEDSDGTFSVRFPQLKQLRYDKSGK
jgi:ATP-dependent DNA ligase